MSQGALGAYYSYDAANPAPQVNDGLGEPLRTDGVGAYYSYDASHEAVQPINGVALGHAAQLSDEAIRAAVGQRPPLMVAKEWAKRITDIAWAPPTSTDELTLLPITDRDLGTVRKSAFGHELPLVAVLSSTTSSMAKARAAFQGTPYVLDHVVGVYNVADARHVPVPFFVAVGRLRDADDADGGSGRMEQVAATLRGRLVYPVALPARSRRALPPIQIALQKPAAKPALPWSSQSGFAQSGVLGAVSSTAMLAGGAVLLAAGIAAAVLIKGR